MFRTSLMTLALTVVASLLTTNPARACNVAHHNMYAPSVTRVEVEVPFVIASDITVTRVEMEPEVLVADHHVVAEAPAYQVMPARLAFQKPVRILRPISAHGRALQLRPVIRTTR
ncbi:MAG: hypothetical protein AB2A00_34440 [Myxococcota bacterium]